MMPLRIRQTGDCGRFLLNRQGMTRPSRQKKTGTDRGWDLPDIGAGEDRS